MPRVTTIEGMSQIGDEHAHDQHVTAMPSRTGTSQLSQIGTAVRPRACPQTVASTPISEPTETSMLPEMITIDMPIAATAI